VPEGGNKLLTCLHGKYGELLIMPPDGRWVLNSAFKGLKVT